MSVAAGISGRAGVDHRFRTLYQLLAQLSRAEHLNQVYDAALNSLFEATAANRAAILLFDEDGVIRFKASRGLSAEYQAAVTGHSPWLRGTRDAVPIVVPDVLHDEALSRFWTDFQREGIRALAFVPLLAETGVIGKFMLYYDQPHESDADELEIAQVIAAHVALATQHKRAEIARARSERRLQAILDNSASVIFIKDLEGRYVLANRRHRELFPSQHNIIGRTDADFFPPELAARFQANDRAVLNAGKPITFEEHAIQEDGLHTYVSMKFPLQEADGQITGVCGIATDITERNRLESASRYLAAIVESSDDAIISKDLNGIITSWNRGAERIFGYTAAEAVGQPVSMLADPDHRNEMPVILSKIRKGERVDHYETRRRRKNGQIIDVALTVSPVLDAQGTIVGASKIARDISGRKHAEEERAQLLLREREARRTAELLNRVGPRLAAQLEPDTLAQEVIDIATALVGAEFGAFCHSLTGRNGESCFLYTLCGVPRENFAHLSENRNLVASTFHGGAVVRCADVSQDPGYNENPFRFTLPDGQPSVRSYLAVPVISRSGELLGGLFFGHSEAEKFTETHEAVAVGISAQGSIAMDNARLFEQGQRVQTELKRSNEELRRANRDLEVFAYSASHDLQEPLRNIAISAQLIERTVGRQTLGDSAPFLSEILTSAKRLGALLDDLLAYTRATKYEEGLPPTVDSARVLADVLEGLRRVIDESGAKITTGDLPPVPMHESRLSQLFQNLISNSLKYRSKEVPFVHVAAVERDGWCVFSVSDNGIGIDPQFAERIFGLFQRLHGRDEYPGSGIGLAICQRVVEQYGGRIWFEQSASGQGSTFCFAIPTRPRY